MKGFDESNSSSSNSSPEESNKYKKLNSSNNKVFFKTKLSSLINSVFSSNSSESSLDEDNSPNKKIKVQDMGSASGSQSINDDQIPLINSENDSDNESVTTTDSEDID